MTLLVCSASTKKYSIDFDYDKILIVDSPPNKEILNKKGTEDDVIAIGGGSVIDTAKILSKEPIMAVPTTFSGASQTSHAVYWDNKKKFNIKRKKPRLLLKQDYLKSLSQETLLYSKMDCLSHIMESFISPRATIESNQIVQKAVEEVHKGNWLEASILAGDAIEITGTGFVHGFSYPLTAKYGIPHGASLGIVLNAIEQYPKIEKDIRKTVYVAMVADFVHVGHINIIENAKKYGKIIIGLLTDEAVKSYKGTPFCPFEKRKRIVENIKGIWKVVPQDSLDYTKNILKYKPEYVVHGDDWKQGVQKEVREKVLKSLEGWGGRLIEIPYTEGISSTDVRKYLTYKMEEEK